MKTINLSDGSRQWAVLVYALTRNRYNALKDVFSDLVMAAKEEGKDAGVIKLDEKFFKATGTMLIQDFHTDLLLKKMEDAGAAQIDDEEEMKALLSKVSDSITDEELKKMMETAAMPDEVPQQDTSEPEPEPEPT